MSAARAATEPEKHVTMSEKTFRDFVRDPNMDWFRNHLHEARGVLIVPKVVKAGFIFGGSGGRAVLVARDESGKWGGPAYYTLATGSVGFQAGLQVSEVIILAMTQKAMDSLLSSSFRVGPDAAIAAGPVGVGTKASFQEDFISFSRSKGLYGGLNLDGTVISANDDWNHEFYGKALSPVDILVRHEGGGRPHAAKLVKAVADAAAAAKSGGAESQ
jgi:lipid-binding SYLF domain-containing protein